MKSLITRLTTQSDAPLRVSQLTECSDDGFLVIIACQISHSIVFESFLYGTVKTGYHKNEAFHRLVRRPNIRVESMTNQTLFNECSYSRAIRFVLCHNYS